MNNQAQEDRISLLKFHILCGSLFHGVFIGAEESHRSRNLSNTSAETSGKQTTEKQRLCVSLGSCLPLSAFWSLESSSSLSGSHKGVRGLDIEFGLRWLLWELKTVPNKL